MERYVITSTMGFSFQSGYEQMYSRRACTQYNDYDFHDRDFQVQIRNLDMLGQRRFVYVTHFIYKGKL